MTCVKRRRISMVFTCLAITRDSRAVIDDDWIFVVGTTGVDYATGKISDDPAKQAERCIRTIAAERSA